jgi:hypothetical protein
MHSVHALIRETSRDEANSRSELVPLDPMPQIMCLQYFIRMRLVFHRQRICISGRATRDARCERDESY